MLQKNMATRYSSLTASNVHSPWALKCLWRGYLVISFSWDESLSFNAHVHGRTGTTCLSNKVPSDSCYVSAVDGHGS